MTLADIGSSCENEMWNQDLRSVTCAGFQLPSSPALPMSHGPNFLLTFFTSLAPQKRAKKYLAPEHVTQIWGWGHLLIVLNFVENNRD